MTAVHLSVFVNGCLDDTNEWYETVADAQSSLAESYYWERVSTGYILGSDTDTVRKYRLFTRSETTGNLLESAYMAEICEYPALAFCDCASNRSELDNETGLYDPSASVQCMACEADTWEAECAMHDAWEAANA